MKTEALIVSLKTLIFPKKTLHHYVVKVKLQKKNDGKVALGHVGYFNGRQVFSNEHETLLSEYLKRASDIYFGLTPKELRKFAFQYAIANNLRVPANWTEIKMAGRDWYTQFIKRNTSLSLRSPEATSLGRATAFNQTNV